MAQVVVNNNNYRVNKILKEGKSKDLYHRKLKKNDSFYISKYFLFISLKIFNLYNFNLDLIIKNIIFLC